MVYILHKDAIEFWAMSPLIVEIDDRQGRNHRMITFIILISILTMFIIHGLGLYISYMYSLNFNEILKILPPTFCSAISSSTVLTIALMNILKTKKLKWNNFVEKDSWNLIVHLETVNKYKRPVKILDINNRFFTCKHILGTNEADPGQSIYLKYELEPIADPNQNLYLAKEITKSPFLQLNISYKFSCSERENVRIRLENKNYCA